MMVSTPVVSVVMPVFNGAKFLAPALDSILSQSFGDFEFVVVDDGSTDETPDILVRYATGDSRVRVLRVDHLGVAAASNVGVRAARGEFLARMDSDDIARADRLEKQLAVMQADQGLGVLGSYVECIDAEGRPIRVFEGPLRHEELDAAHLRGGPRLWHPSVMMRTEFLRRAGGYSEKYPYTEDYELWLRMAEICRLGTVPEPLVRYRLHLNSVSVSKRDLQVVSAERALADTLARRGLQDVGKRPVAAEAPASELKVIRKWAWWALRAGNIATARHYALKSLRAAPLSRESLSLALSVLRAGLPIRS